MLEHRLQQSGDRSLRHVVHFSQRYHSGEYARHHGMMVFQAIAVECGNEIQLHIVEQIVGQAG